VEYVGNMEQFTIITKVRVYDVSTGLPMTILGHSSCGCWGLLINEDGQLDFEVRCDGTVFSSGFSMYLGADVVIAVTYDGTTADFYINGGLANSENILLSMRCGGDLDIGSYSITQS